MTVAQKVRAWLERVGIRRRRPLADSPPIFVIELVPIAATVSKTTPGDTSPPAALPVNLPALPVPAAPAVCEWREKLPTQAFADRFARWMSSHEELADTDLIVEELMHYAAEFADLIQAECPSEMALTKTIGAYRSGAPRAWKYATDRKVRKQHYRFPSPAAAKAPPRRRVTRQVEGEQLQLIAA